MAVAATSIFGFGIVRPFRRDQKSDVTTAGGADLVKAAIDQILGTNAADDRGTFQGECPWNPAFGSKLYLLKHRKGPAVEHLARIYALEAIQRWEPRVTIVECEPSLDLLTFELDIDLAFQLVKSTNPKNLVTMTHTRSLAP